MVGQNVEKISEKAVSRGAGRPRSLTLDDVLDAAIDIGLGGLSMTALAAKLGVGTATIYTYVPNRDALVRLAAVRHAKRPRFDDLGQHWSDLVRGHAEKTFALCSAEPQLLVQHMSGLNGPDMHVDYLDGMLAALTRRGFSVSEAYQLYSATNTIVFGAVVRATYVGALRGKGYGHEGAVRRTLAEHALDALPHVRACEDFADESRAFAWKDTLERLIESYAVEFERLERGTAKTEHRKPKRTPAGSPRARSR